MENKKKLMIIAILGLICLLSIAVTCNQCSAKGTEEEKIDVGEEKVSSDEEAEAGTGEDIGTGEDEGEEAGNEAPTISLEIYEGPTPAPGNIVYYRVKAEVTGNPEPKIEFSKDDSNGAWGEDIAQVNLAEGETYTLVATATNSEGYAEDSITLSRDSGQEQEEEAGTENSPPEIIEIKISQGTIFVGAVMDVEVIAEDADEDSLSYKWIADEGSFSDRTARHTEYTVPGEPGTYIISVQVKDGRGGIDTESKAIEVVAH